MAYSDFTLDRLTRESGADFVGGDIFADVVPVVPGEWLAAAIRIAQQVGFGSDKSRSERLVSPVYAR